MNFFSYDFLFTLNTVTVERVDKIFAAVAISFVVVAIAFKLSARVTPNVVKGNLLKRLFKLTGTIGILEALWYGARFENIRFFGTHFTYILILLVGLIWFVFILVYRIRHYPRERMEWERQQIKMKYLS